MLALVPDVTFARARPDHARRRSLAGALGDKPIALLRGHGNVVVGPNLQVTVRDAIDTEVNAKMQTIALGLGGPVTSPSTSRDEAVGTSRAAEPCRLDAQ